MSQQIFKAAFGVSSMTLLSRIFGLLRDVIIAYMFGARDNTDAFFIAFKVPNYFRRLFAEGGFSQAFVPVLSEYRQQRSEDEVKELINNVLGCFSSVLLSITSVGILAAPIFVYLFASGFINQAGKFELTVSMLRITFPYLMLISLTALAAGILNTYKQFVVPAFTPVLLNIGIISGALFLSPHLQEPVMALAWGVLLAGVVQLVFQVPFLIRLEKMPVPQFNWQHEGVRRIRQLMIPTLFSGSVAQLNIMIDMMIASWLVSGSISWLYYSDRLMEFPLGVFGVALATVILPNLSEQYATGSREVFSQLLNWAMRLVIAIALPATIALIILSEPLLATIFHYGEFSAEDVYNSQLSLVAYAVGLLGLIFIKVFSNGFFARQDTKTPVKVAFIAMAVNLVFNIILVFPLAHAGLALATSISATVNSGLLFYLLLKRDVLEIEKGWGLYLFQILTASAVMALVLLALMPEAGTWLNWNILNRVQTLALLVFSGTLSYFASLYLLGIRPADFLSHAQ